MKSFKKFDGQKRIRNSVVQVPVVDGYGQSFNCYKETLRRVNQTCNLSPVVLKFNEGQTKGLLRQLQISKAKLLKDSSLIKRATSVIHNNRRLYQEMDKFAEYTASTSKRTQRFKVISSNLTRPTDICMNQNYHFKERKQIQSLRGILNQTQVKPTSLPPAKLKMPAVDQSHYQQITSNTHIPFPTPILSQDSNKNSTRDLHSQHRYSEARMQNKQEQQLQFNQFSVLNPDMQNNNCYLSEQKASTGLYSIGQQQNFPHEQTAIASRSKFLNRVIINNVIIQNSNISNSTVLINTQPVEQMYYGNKSTSFYRQRLKQNISSGQQSEMQEAESLISEVRKFQEKTQKFQQVRGKCRSAIKAVNTQIVEPISKFRQALATPIKKQFVAQSQPGIEQLQSQESKGMKATLNMFEMHQVLGYGHFGQVQLVKYTGPSELQFNLAHDKFYALKTIRLTKQTKSKQIDHLYGEKKSLQLVTGLKLFTQLRTTFLTKQSACFVLDHIDGINLYQYQHECVMLPIETVKYCSALALEMLTQLHEKNLIYRDLKPENIMVKRQNGKLVLVDFGFAKSIKLQGRTFTKCGTPGYSAPEILLQADEDCDSYTMKLRQQTALGYSYPSDIWSWGVLVCELVGGYNPFSSQANSVLETFKNIINGKVQWPKNLPPQLHSLLKRVFERDQQQRITISEIKKSQFFDVSLEIKQLLVQGVDWSNLNSYFSAEIQEMKQRCDEIMLKIEKTYISKQLMKTDGWDATPGQESTQEMRTLVYNQQNQNFVPKLLEFF